jgi:Ca-activated chloride channel homolog
VAGSGPQRAGRHRRLPENPHNSKNPQRRRVTVLAAGTAVVLSAGLIGLTAYSWLGGARGDEPNTPRFLDATGALVPADALPAAAGSQPCTVVRVLASPENAPVLGALAEAYQGAQRSIVGHCVTVTVAGKRSGMAATEVASGFGRMAPGDRPAIWAPDSSAWLELARRSAIQASQPVVLPQQAPPTAHTPIVIAMPRPQAAALGWPDLHPSWRDYFGAGSDEVFWARHGHPEWGRFRVGRANPAMASSGLYGLVAEYAALAGHSGPLQAAEVSNPGVGAQVSHAELAIPYYSASDEHFLWHIRQAWDSGDTHSLVSALTTTEQALWDYNHGIVSKDGVTHQQIAPPQIPLVPIYPRDGTFFVDCPLAVLTGTWVDAQQHAAADDFVRFVQTPQGQAVARAHGYRDVLGRMDPLAAQIGSYGDITHLAAFPEPAPDVLNAVQQHFIQVRKRARVLFLLDVSASMNDQIGNGQTRLQAAEDAIVAALTRFAPDDEVGLAAFSAAPGRTDILPGLLNPVSPIGTKHSDLVAQLHSVQTHELTPLYDSVIKSTALMAGPGYDPDAINAVVLLTDGRNDIDGPTQSQMNASLAELAQHNRDVMVFTLAYAGQADKTVLELITKLTHAAYYDASDPLRISPVLGDLVSSF